MDASPPISSHSGKGSVAPPALTQDQLASFQKAERSARKIRRAATVARTDGVITGFFAAACIVFFFVPLVTRILSRQPLSDLGWENAVLGTIFTAVAINAFRGANRIRKYDPDAATILMLNQFYLAGTIILYALYGLHAALAGGSDAIKELESLGASGQDIADLERKVIYAFYGLLIVGTIVGQGAMAIYYITRRKLIEAHLRETPQWVMDLQRRQVY